MVGQGRGNGGCVGCGDDSGGAAVMRGAGAGPVGAPFVSSIVSI